MSSIQYHNVKQLTKRLMRVYRKYKLWIFLIAGAVAIAILQLQIPLGIRRHSVQGQKKDLLDLRDLDDYEEGYFMQFIGRFAHQLPRCQMGINKQDPQEIDEFCCSNNFDCGDGKIIRCKFVNDNYCDCSNGRDEPGTSACSHRGSKFNCGDGQIIPGAFVDDGVCDCRNSADEIIGTCLQLEY